MDDTFLSFSTQRFNEGKKLLGKLSDMGWQIMYFTAKNHDSKALSKISGNKVITLKQLP